MGPSVSKTTAASLWLTHWIWLVKTHLAQFWPGRRPVKIFFSGMSAGLLLAFRFHFIYFLYFINKEIHSSAPQTRLVSISRMGRLHVWSRCHKKSAVFAEQMRKYYLNIKIHHILKWHYLLPWLMRVVVRWRIMAEEFQGVKKGWSVGCYWRVSQPGHGDGGLKVCGRSISSLLIRFKACLPPIALEAVNDHVSKKISIRPDVHKGNVGSKYGLNNLLIFWDIPCRYSIKNTLNLTRLQYSRENQSAHQY